MYIFDGPVNFCFSFFVAFCNDEFPVGCLNSLPEFGTLCAKLTW